MEASGPNGDLDLYFSEGALAVAHSALFSYCGKESDAKVGCPRPWRTINCSISRTCWPHWLTVIAP